MNRRIPLVVLAAAGGLAVLAGQPPEAGAYINAGFKSASDYKTFERHQNLVDKIIYPHTAVIRADPKNPEAYRRRAAAWRTVPAYQGPWPHPGTPDPRLDPTYQAECDLERARELEATARRNAPPK